MVCPGTGNSYGFDGFPAHSHDNDIDLVWFALLKSRGCGRLLVSGELCAVNEYCSLLVNDTAAR